jgi:hypothetical protein
MDANKFVEVLNALSKLVEDGEGKFKCVECGKNINYIKKGKYLRASCETKGCLNLIT